MIPILVKYGDIFQARAVGFNNRWMFVAKDILLILGFNDITKSDYEDDICSVTTSMGIELVPVIYSETVWHILGISNICDKEKELFSLCFEDVVELLNCENDNNQYSPNYGELLKVRTLCLPEQEKLTKDYNIKMLLRNFNTLSDVIAEDDMPQHLGITK